MGTDGEQPEDYFGFTPSPDALKRIAEIDAARGGLQRARTKRTSSPMERKLSGDLKARKTYLVKRYEENRRRRFDLIRHLVLVERRLDVLAEHVLGVRPEPFHTEMIAFQEGHEQAMILGFRGSAKTYYLNVVRCIAEILWDPNVRILLVSNARAQSVTPLRQIKQHFEHNELLRSIFGDYVSKERWGEDEIVVAKRTENHKEPTITCAGVETALPGRHFDIIIADDLVTEENARTEPQREKTKVFWYKTLEPTLAPRRPHWPAVPGKRWVLGTRYHNLDLYGWLENHDMKGVVKVVSALNDEDESIWPTEWPTAKLREKRSRMGVAIFDSQYQCRTDAMRGEIFEAEWFREYTEAPPLEAMFVWQGVDLAISQKDTADKFAIVTVGVEKATRKIFVLAYWTGRLTFKDQLAKVAVEHDRWQPIRVVIESNAYQLALSQALRAEAPHVRFHPHMTLKDKVTRARMLSAYAQRGDIYVKAEHSELVEQLCLLPSGRFKDLFDALDLAVSTGLRGVRKRREQEFGIL